MVVLKRKPWEPYVTQDDGRLIYHLPVESGFLSKGFLFAITGDHLQVLMADEERFYQLFALLHHRYQLEPSSEVPKKDPYFDLILFRAAPSVVRLLDDYDAESNGAISRLFSNHFATDGGALRKVPWFAALKQENT